MEGIERIIKIIPSKSFAHRAYILDFLAGGDGSSVSCSLDSDDIKATRSCLAGLREGDSDIDVRESGSTLRFILPLAGALGKSVTIHTSGRLSKRPMGPFEDELRSHGMEIEHLPGGLIRVSGKLTPGTFRLPGSISSQFITGLLLSLPYLEGDSRIELTSGLKSKAYVDITLSVLTDYGVNIKEYDNTYIVNGYQKYSSFPYDVEGDWSQAAFWLAAGLIGKESVEISGLRADSVQGDRKIVEILRSMGGRIELSEEDGRTYFTSYPSKLHGIDVSVSEVPDLAPAIAACASAAEGVTRLTDAERLRLKESDRIKSITECLKCLGVQADEVDDEIVIRGGEGIRGGEAETSADHRIVMMAAVLSLVSESKVTIKDSRAVSKSYPTFFDEMEKAGFAENIVRE